MKIPITINGEMMVLEAHPSMTLLDVLRREGFISAKLGCSQGRCGSCTVLMDGKAIPTCIIPFVATRDASIVTMEQFSKTKEYELIIESFEKAASTETDPNKELEHTGSFVKTSTFWNAPVHPVFQSKRGIEYE